MEEIVNLLCEFNYREKHVVRRQATGWMYMIIITSRGIESDGKTIMCQFTEDSIRIGNTWYKGSQGYFTRLVEIFNAASNVN